MNNLPPEFLIAVAIVVGMVGLLAFGVFVLIGRQWLRAFMHGVPVPLIRILAMRLRGNSPQLLIDAYIALRHSGTQASLNDVEHAYIDARNQIQTSDDLVELVRRRADGQ